ncbi:MAG: PAS domain S-box protein, partial [Burkholderiaceae bacterium]|nr:PAS domain S-box protein [Burkholderiaceae bacterium]
FVVRSYRNRLRQIGRIADQLTQRTRELEASRRRLQTAIDVSGTVFWEYDLRSDSLSFETARLAAMGLPVVSPPMTLRRWLALVHPHDRTHLVAWYQDCLAGAASDLDGDCRIRAEQGGWVWVHVRGAVIAAGPEGAPRLMAGGVANIEARKRSEEALRISQKTSQHLAQLLHSLCDNVPDMIWAKDLKGHYLFANRAICEQLLCADSTDEPLGRNDLFFAQRERERHPDNATWHTFGELCQDSDVVTLQCGAPSQFEEWGNVKGQPMVLDVRKAPFVNDQGVVVGVVGTGRNVTEHKVEQDKLRLAALVLEHSSEALMITDEANAIVEVNPAFTRLTGYSREDALGQTPSILRSGRQGAEFYRRMW